ncbi:uncharacterized protein ELE39_002425 [Cryptosporidium sp. chipmunk genotype I]|uniref:uncharacterized protein n=1 Tax=Cryptosporidium sp. chipmunk genotype I TaxID=1280935 RepID=UPI00351A6307|nr:transmembrane protein [Cryptosporidium sp. chipmunk genotype I]
MMLSSKSLLLFIFLVLFQSIFCSSNGEEILQFCKKHNITLSELEDEARQAGISVKTLIGMMNAEYPSPIGGPTQKKSTSELENLHIDSPTGHEDVLGFVPSSSVIYSSDMIKNTTIEEPATKAVSETKPAAPLDTETLKLSENTLFVNKGGIETADYNKLRTSVKAKSPKERREIGKRYFIINKNGEKEEYRVVSYRPKLNRAVRSASGTEEPKRVKVIKRYIQPLIIAQPSIAPLRVPMQMPQMPRHPGYVTPPQIPYFPPQIPQSPSQVPQFPSQAPPQVPQMPSQTRDVNDFDYMNRNSNNGFDSKNSFIGPLTISIIVIILIICCIIGGFCFCGATGAKRNHENMPLLPPHPNNSPQQPPYNSRTPIVPQNQQLAQPPPGRQVFGYAIVPNIR